MTTPADRLTPDDAGPLGCDVGIRDGRVVLRFTRPTRWLGLRPADAIALAEALREYARIAAESQVQ